MLSIQIVYNLIKNWKENSISLPRNANSKTITIKSPSDLCLTSESRFYGAKISLRLCGGSESQQWLYDNKLLRSKELDHMCLDIGGWNRSDGAEIILWECYGNENQRWTIDRIKIFSDYLNDSGLPQYLNRYLGDGYLMPVTASDEANGNNEWIIQTNP